MKIGTNYWTVSWGGGAADPFRDGHTNVTGEDPWKPEFLEETAFYTSHRFMDWNRTNNSEQRSWANRPQKGDVNQRTVAYEWMIDLCNRHQADAWITVPHLTFEDQAYWTSLAELLLEQLSPALRLYIEYSNETWNFGFDQAAYCRDRGVELGLDSDQYKAGFEFHVYAAVRLFEHFEAVWGAGNPRLEKVISGQSVNTWITGVHLAALQNATINPNNVQATAYAIAPYFGSADSSSVNTAIDRTRQQSEMIADSGLKLIAYEGGQHVMTNAHTVNRDPSMYDYYRDYLQGIEPYLEEFSHYCHSSSYESGGAWGAKEGIGQPIAQAHKYRALWDYADASPEPDEETLVPFNAIWKFTLDSPADGWTLIDFDDGTWDMQENEEESAVYLRKTFTNIFENPDGLVLSVQHDHGFVAYLNGTEILNVAANSNQRVFHLNEHVHLLQSDNVLAIRLHIDDFDKTDLSVNPELKAVWNSDD
jgi:hypothetical protein